MNTTEKLLRKLNSARGVNYPDIGFAYYADTVGNGIAKPRIYTIVNANGGVTFSNMNDRNARLRCEKIRAAIEAAKLEKENNHV